jgi:hypothetical protein
MVSTELYHAFPLFILLLITIQQALRAEQVGMNAIIRTKTPQKKNINFNVGLFCHIRDSV